MTVLRRSLRVLGAAAVAVLGALAAVSGAIMSLRDIRVLGIGLPVGLVFTLVAAALFFVSAAIVLARAGSIAASLGWAAGLAACLWPKPEGDVVIPPGWSGLLFIVGSALIAAWVLGRTLAAPRPPSAPT